MSRVHGRTSWTSPKYGTFPDALFDRLVIANRMWFERTGASHKDVSALLDLAVHKLHLASAADARMVTDRMIEQTYECIQPTDLPDLAP